DVTDARALEAALEEELARRVDHGLAARLATAGGAVGRDGGRTTAGAWVRHDSVTYLTLQSPVNPASGDRPDGGESAWRVSPARERHAPRDGGVADLLARDA